MEPRAVGLETEYAQCMERHDRGLRVVDAGFLFERMEAILLAEHRTLKADSFGRGRQSVHVAIREGRFVDVGARFYFDAGHLEWASPEATSATEAALYDQAAERTIAAVAAQIRPPGEGSRLMIVKNNIDYARGRTYGCHENYQVVRMSPASRDEQFFARLVSGLVPFLVTRQIYTGAGRIGGAIRRGKVPGFQLSQRADFIEQITCRDTRSERGFINLRDEALADGLRYRRLHLIAGDSNRSPVATLLKLGTTRLVLRALEADGLDGCVELADPIDSQRAVSADLTCQELLRLRDGSQMTPIQIQRWYLDRCTALPDLDRADRDVLFSWHGVLADLERGFAHVADRVDWAAKLTYVFGPVLQRYGTKWEEVGAWSQILSRLGPDECDHTRPPSERLRRETGRIVAQYGLDWADYGTQLRLYFDLRERDLRYHDIDPVHGLFAVLCRRGLVRLPDEEAEIVRAQTMPPHSRAQVRAGIIKWAHEHGMAEQATLDWGTAMVCGDGPLLFQDPCAPRFEGLDRLLERALVRALPSAPPRLHGRPHEQGAGAAAPPVPEKKMLTRILKRISGA